MTAKEEHKTDEYKRNDSDDDIDIFFISLAQRLKSLRKSQIYEIIKNQHRKGKRKYHGKIVVKTFPEILKGQSADTHERSSGKDLLECFRTVNESGQAAILMVTHDAFCASYAKDVYILNDGMMRCRLSRGNDRREFYDRIMEVQASMGKDDRSSADIDADFLLSLCQEHIRRIPDKEEHKTDEYKRNDSDDDIDHGSRSPLRRQSIRRFMRSLR